MNNRPRGRMHDFLTDMTKFNQNLPIYIENALSPEDDAAIRKLLDSQIEQYGIRDISDPLVGTSRFVPRIMPDLARVVIEFEMPEETEQKIDKIVKPLYSEEIKMSHYSYLGYDLKYSDGKTAPALPPHIDAAETLVTFNYQIGGNIDWDIFVDGERFELKSGDVVIFSAVNQVHWRPKRAWSEGDYTEILTINYSPLDNWRFTGENDPLDGNLYPKERQEYQETLNNNPRMQKAWDLYNQMGLADGIPNDRFGIVATK